MTDSHDFRREIEHLRRELRANLANSQESRVELWKELAGENFAKFSSPDAMQTYLEHPDAKVRCIALWVSSDRWALDAKIAQHCEKMALSDPDQQVRGIAATSLGACYRNTRDKVISGILASIIANEHNSSEVRLSAYVSLLEVQGKSLLSHDPPLRNLKDICLATSIDWNFVKCFMV